MKRWKSSFITNRTWERFTRKYWSRKKYGIFKNIHTRCLKDVSDECSPILANIWNEGGLLNKNFPENLKLADITTIFKKEDKTFVKNYKPVRVLPTVSKTSERIMQKHITGYMGKFICPFLYEYRKGFSTQYALLSLIERWKLCLDKQGFVRALLRDYSGKLTILLRIRR